MKKTGVREGASLCLLVRLLFSEKEGRLSLNADEDAQSTILSRVILMGEILFTFKEKSGTKRFCLLSPPPGSVCYLNFKT